MTRYFLTRLTIEGFRGVNNDGTPLTIQFSPGCVNSIFAANGMGKSSIFEALHYAIRGNVPSLVPLQQQEHPDRYVNNLFHTRRTATIVLQLTPDDTPGSPVEITVTRDQRGVRTVTGTIPDPDSLLEALDTDFTLLDHRTFNDFIDSSALTRGRTLAPLLGLSQYSSLRRGIQAATNTQAFDSTFQIASIDAAVRQQRQDEEAALGCFCDAYLRVTGHAAPTTELSSCVSDIVESLETISLLQPEVVGKPLASIDFTALRELVLKAEGGAQREELQAHDRVLARLAPAAPDATAVQANLLDIRHAFDLYEHELRHTSGDLVKRLNEAAERLLVDGNWPNPLVCPLCGSRLETSITEGVSATLERYSATSTAYERVSSLLSGSAALAALHRLESAGLLEEDEREIAGSLEAKSTTGSLRDADLKDLEARLQLLTERRASVAAETKRQREDILKGLPASLVAVSNSIGDAEQALNHFNTVEKLRATRGPLEQKQRKYGEWKSFISRMAEAAADAEVGAARSAISRLEADYREMFSSIVTVRDIVPSLERQGADERLDLHLSDFHGIRDVSARALLSESYRNALAISVFLTAAAKNAQASRFVVLDDVTSSFDSGNQFQLLEYIRSNLQFPRNPAGLQFILLSHDVTLEKFFDKNQGEVDWRHQKLQGWPPQSPISALQQDADRLRKEAVRYINAGDTVAAGGLVRQYLEFVIQQVVSKVRIPVPFDLAVKDHARMVDACLGAICEAVDIHRRLGDLVLDPGQASDLASRHAPALVCNWVAHFATGGAAAFAPPAMLGVLDDVDELRRCFQFEDPIGSGNWRFYRSLTSRK